MPEAIPKKVFCSHRSVDKPAVEAFARRLRERGIDAWYDAWEIQPGDDIVARINEGLAECDCGLIFFSAATAGSPWVSAEVSTLIYRMIEEGLPLIPVMIEADAEVPALLGPRARRGIEELDSIVDAILGRTAKPPLGPPPSPPRVTRFLLGLAPSSPGTLRLTAHLDGEPLAEVEVAFSDSLRRSYAEFLSGRLKPLSRGPAEARAAALEGSLESLGQELGRALFPGIVGETLSGMVAESRPGDLLEVTFEAAEPALLSLPFEAARLATRRHSQGLPIALYPEVTVLRRPAPVVHEPAPQAPLPGPLKILVAVGAPDEEETASAVLDLEAELQGILDAVEHASQHGNAQVRILEVGHPEEIRKALTQDSFHVLHLSSHGRPGALELEDEEGRPVEVTAHELADKLREAGRPLPLVFLSSCHGGTAAQPRARSETTSFAQGLLQAGVPLVLAMQSRVTDLYASHLAGCFYEELCRGDRPLASRALAQARRLLEAARRERVARGTASAEESQPEYATASLFTAGDEAPLLDHSLHNEPLQASPIHTTTGPLPHLRVGDLVGRRSELRETLQSLRGHPKAVAAHGWRAGVQLLGMGGVGKSSVAGRALTRLQEEDWLVAAWSGAFHLGGLARRAGEALAASGIAELGALGAELSRPDLDDEARQRQLIHLLQTRRLLLVLDNFETNLTPGGKAYLDPTLALQLEELCAAATTGKLLVTCRYPLPGRDAELHALHLGPLSPAQMRKLAWRLPALEALRREEPRELAEVLRRLGGHPRMLEYLDGLLRGGTGHFPRITRQLKELAGRVRADLGAAAGDLDRATRAALVAGAEDILLDELLAQVEAAGDLETLLQAAVSSLPLLLQDLARALAGEPGAPQEPESVGPLRESVARLVQTSLLTPLEVRSGHAEPALWVHRWTAESLAERHGGEPYRERCRRMGEVRIWRVRNVSHSLDDGMEAVSNFLAARAFDRAAEEAWSITEALLSFRQLASAGAFASEVLRALPEEHPGYLPLADVELQANMALGFTQLAVERGQQLVKVCEGKLEAEPDRADYQRDLSVSFNKMGDLLTALGQGDAARKAYQDALDIAQRLAQAEPDRADYQVDLVVSLVRMAQVQPAEAPVHLRRAHTILTRLHGEGRLAPRYQPWLEKLEEALAAQRPPGEAERD